MRIAICDDSEKDQNITKQYCLEAGETNVTLFSSGEELLKSTEEFDLLFLDIEMAGLSGIDIMQNFEMKRSHMLIVFCTTHEEKSIETHGRNVINFLTKPVSPREIMRCIQKTRNLSHQFQIVSLDDTEIVCGDILYAKATPPYTSFYTRNGATHLSLKSLRDWEKSLESLPFYRISRSTLVNFQNTHEVRKELLILNTGERLSISRRLRSSIADLYREYHRKQMRY